MGIYSRDNINYAGMLQNMLAAKERGAAIRANALRNQGQIWGDTIKGVGNTFGNALLQYGQEQDAAQKYQDEQSWKAKQFAFQQQQLAQQKALQEEQMNLSRELAGAQKVKEAEYQQDENMKNWQIANASLQAAEEELKKDPNNPTLIKNRDTAQINADYWGKKAGVQIPMKEPVVPAEPAQTPAPQDQPLTNVDLTAKLNEVLSREYTDATKAEAQEIVDQIPDPKVKAEAQKRINEMGLTKEGKATANAAAKAKAQKKLDEANVEFQKLGTLQKRQFLKDHPEYKANGGKLGFAKK